MKKKTILIIIVIFLILLILSFLSTIIFSVININNSNIFSGITINNVKVSGLTKEEAISKLNNLIEDKSKSGITLKYTSKDNEKNYEKTIDFSTIEINYDIDTAVTEAYSLGRTGTIFQNNFNIAKALIAKQNINIPISINEKDFETIIADISTNLPDKLIENSYYIENDKLIITKGSAGTQVDKENLKSILLEHLNTINSNENIIEVPTIYSEPNPIDIDTIYAEVHKEPQDAYYKENPFKVYTEVKGIDFDIEKARKIITENPTKKEYSINLEYTEPKVKLTDLDINLFPDLLGTFTTRYDASNKERSNNLNLATNKINGTILSPGEEFSYNKIVGERSIEAGYKEAKIYANGKVIDGIGGGICQISSTLYNAVVFANLDVTTRYNHQFITSYVKAGRDATVAYGSKDFKFKNNRSYPIKILMSANSGIVKVDIYGIKEDKEYSIDFEVETISNIPFKTEYQEDSSLKPGTEQIKQVGTDGVIVNVYKITKQNGIIISREIISKDTYNALPRVILRNTKSSNN